MHAFLYLPPEPTRESAMAYRTHLVLESGDRRALDTAVEAIVAIADRKGATVMGPHAKPTRHLRVPRYKSVAGAAEFDPWRYDVFVRELVVIGHEAVARSVATSHFASSIDVSITLEEATDAKK